MNHEVEGQLKSLDSSKIVRKVAKDLLRDFSPIRISDRCWSYDGGWYLVHFNFDPSGFTKGSHSELALQNLFSWHTYVTLGGISAPRRFVELNDPAEFEQSLRKNVSELIPIASRITSKIRSPRDLLLLWPRTTLPSSRFELGVMLGLERRRSFARVAFRSVIKTKQEYPDGELACRLAEMALRLLDDSDAFYDFVDLMVIRSRNAILGLEHSIPKPYPWTVRSSA